MQEHRFVTYYRVSTQAQGRSGLGLEAQRIAVEQYLRSRGGNLIGKFTEVETGKGACGFRSMPGRHSGPCRSTIPEHAGPPFRCMPGHPVRG